MKPKVLVIVGPTAVGKTQIAIRLAQKYQCEIISGDSVAVYRGLDIGSAKPSKEEQELVKHHLIDVADPQYQYSVADFQKEAQAIINTKERIIICGGTGLYIQSVLFDYEFVAAKRDRSFDQKYADWQTEDLYRLLLSSDAQLDSDKIHPHNRRRILRALEVLEKSGSSIHSFHHGKNPKYDFYIVYLTLPRPILYERIDRRVDEMFRQGLEREVFDLYQNNVSLHAIGYKEFIPYFEQKCTLEEVKENIKKNTRHLAKRQETWFKNQLPSHFYEVSLQNVDQTVEQIENDIKTWMVTK